MQRFIYYFFLYPFIPIAHHIGHRQHSPVGQVRNSNLRVVIPGSMNNSGLQANDEISYNEVSKLSRFFFFFHLFVWSHNENIFFFFDFNLFFIIIASATIIYKYSGCSITNAQYIRHTISSAQFIWCPRFFNKFKRCYGFIQLESSEYK